MGNKPKQTGKSINALLWQHTANWPNKQTNAACNNAGGKGRDKESAFHQLTECLCPIPIITYLQDVLLAVQRAPQQKKERKEDIRNISMRFEVYKGGSCGRFVSVQMLSSVFFYFFFSTQLAHSKHFGQIRLSTHTRTPVAEWVATATSNTRREPKAGWARCTMICRENSVVLYNINPYEHRENACSADWSAST